MFEIDVPKPKRTHKIIGIVGSRRRDAMKDFQVVLNTFMTIYKQGDWIVSGGCPEGGDRFAEDIAKDIGISIIIHYPRKNDLDQDLLIKNPRAAWATINFARNTLIAEDCDVLIACVAKDRTGDTEDTIAKASRFGKKVMILVE